MNIKKRQSRTIPFGWKSLGEIIEEIPEETKALEIAKWYVLGGYTLKSTRDWLVKETSREITIPGMVKAIKNVRPRNPTQEGQNGQTPQEYI